MVTVTTQRDLASDRNAVPQPRVAGAPAQHGRSSCCRCGEVIVQGLISGTPATWATASDGDPWCQGGAHLPKGIHH
jgi:hypothetical protein